jgi:non-specific protein-tyrosine kinase
MPVSIESSAFEVLLAHFRANYGWILFVAPPVLSYTDAVMLSTKVDAICLVLTCEVSRLEAVLEAKAALEAVQGKVVGAVLTGLRI